MDSTRSLLCWFFLPFLCLCFFSACNGKSQEPAARNPAAEDPFAGEPRFTPDVHFSAGQVHESKISAPTSSGQPLPANEILRYQAAALNQYAAALKLDPNHTPSLYRSAVVLGDMKRHDQSIGMWQRYADAVGQTPNSLVNLAIAFEMAGRPTDAETTYRKAIRLDPQHVAAHVNLGVLLARQGKIQPAREVLSPVLDPAAVHWHLAAGLAAGGHQREAEQHFHAAAQLDPAFSRRPESGRTARVE